MLKYLQTKTQDAPTCNQDTASKLCDVCQDHQKARASYSHSKRARLSSRPNFCSTNAGSRRSRGKGPSLRDQRCWRAPQMCSQV